MRQFTISGFVWGGGVEGIAEQWQAGRQLASQAARQPAAAAGLAMQRGRVAGCCYHTCIRFSLLYVVNICIAGIIADI